MARTLSATETKLYAADGHSVRLRVIVKDETGNDLNLTDLEGRSWVESVEISDDIDQPVVEASITLIGFEDDLNLAPTVTQSKINRPGGALQARLGVNREIKIESALVPEHAGEPASGDWRLIFHGDVDEIDIPSDGTSSQIRLRCRDLGGRLQRRWLQRTGQWEAGIPIAVTAYQTDAVNVETIMQEILDDWGPGGIALDTPVSPGWQIPKDSWEPEMTNVLDVLRSLASRIGWEVRYRWDSASGTYKLRFYEPLRTNTTPDVTLGPDQYFGISRFADSLSGVRNRIEVFYRNGTTEEAETKSEVREDAASQTKYGLLYSSIGENETTGITTALRAGQLAELVLSDLKEPRAQFAANAVFLYQVELHDLIRFTPNALLFDTNQDLAVVGYRHHFSADRVETELTCRPGVVGRWKYWWDKVGDGDRGESVVKPSAPTLAAVATIRGVKLSVTGILVKHGMVEWHVSTTSGFTPDASTLKARVYATTHVLADLIQGTTYYAKARVIGSWNIPSSASNEVTFTPGQAESADVATGAITSTKIGAAAVVAGKIANDAVDTAQIASNAVVTGKLAAGAVDSGVLGANAVSDSHINSGAAIAGNKMSSTFALPGSLSVATTAVVAGAATLNGVVEATQGFAVTKANADGMPFAVVVDRSETNYITNPSFEVDTAGWSPFATSPNDLPTLASVTTQKLFGSRALHIDSNDSTPTGLYIGAEAAPVVVAPVVGDIWTASAWVKLGAGSRPFAVIEVEFQTSGGAFIDTSVSVNEIGTEWTHIRVTSAATTASTEKVVVRVLGDTADNIFDLYVDGVQLEKAAEASSYLDGSLGTGYAWTGTANASSSTRTGGLRQHGATQAAAPPFVVYDDGEIACGPLTPSTGSATEIGLPGALLQVAGAGTKFPRSPSTNDVFFRTDRGITYYWNGTAWLCVMQDQVAWRVYQTVNQPTPAANTLTKILYTSTYAPSSPTIDLSSGFDRPNSRFVCPVKGIYSYTIRLGWSNPQATQRCSQYLYKNGAAFELVCVAINDATGGSVPYYRAQGIVNCNANDYLEHWVYEDGSVGNRVVTGGTFEGFLALAQP